MKLLLPLALAAAPLALAAAPAAAQVNGIATSSPEAVFASSAARTAAYGQINQTYAAQIQQLNQLRQQAQDLQRSLDTNGDGQLSPQEAQANPGVQQQLGQLQQQVDAAGRPLQLAQVYVIEQLIPLYQQAQQRVVQQRGIQLMLVPDAFQYAADGVNVTGDLVNALNTLAPSVQATPPAGYQPQRAAVELHQGVQQVLVIAAAQQQAAQAQAAQQPTGR